MPQIRINARPNGVKCNHVHITDLDGLMLRSCTIQELRAQVRDGDDFLIAQIKRMARESGITELAQLKTYLESKDFDY